MSDAAVEVASVWKRFRLGETHDSLRDLIAAGISRAVGRQRNGVRRECFWALEDVSFEVPRGEAIGIIGPNGAGKSTMLKLLAGILRPDRGTIRVGGRLAALIEVGAGFHGDLTGRENIFLNGAILGMSREEIRRKLDRIVEFAGIARFLDMPVKRYSSGMYARLGFSIAAHVDPDVLVVDEVLSVGDAMFRLRCLERMRELVAGGTTLVFVTHDLEQMQAICTRAVVLDGGAISFAGAAPDAVGHYLRAMSRAYTARPPDLIEGGRRDGAVAAIRALRVCGDAGEEVVWTRPGDPIVVEVELELERPVRKLVVELNLRANVNQNLVSINSGRDGRTFAAAAGRHALRLRLPGLPLNGGQYAWNVRLWDAESGEALVDTPFRYPMAIDDGGCKTGVVCVEHEWQFEPVRAEASVATPAGAERGDDGRAGEAVADRPRGGAITEVLTAEARR